MFYHITGASIRVQAVVHSLMLLVVDDAGVEKLLTEEVECGGDVSVATGPVGAEAGARPGASILSVSRTRGVFAGADIGGSTMRFDKDANAEAYGHDHDVKAVLFRHTVTQGVLKQFQDVLNDYAPARQ